MLIDWNEFSQRLRDADPTVTFEWGRTGLHIVPAEVTRDKWHGYYRVCGSFKVSCMSRGLRYRFYASVKRVMPFGNGNRFFGVPDPLPPLSASFEKLQRDVKDLQEYNGIYDSPAACERAEELLANPFVARWK